MRVDAVPHKVVRIKKTRIIDPLTEPFVRVEIQIDMKSEIVLLLPEGSETLEGFKEGEWVV